MNFDIVPLLIIAFSLVFVAVGAWMLVRQQWFIQWLKGTAGLLLVLVAVYLSFFAFNLYSYHELTEEEPVATVSFRKMGEREFLATVARPGGEKRDFKLRGDLWQLDARIIKWKGIFSLLGVHPGYQLDRISGRYVSLEAERSRERTVYSLHREGLGFDLWENAQKGWSPLIDARYGSATYLPMADGAIFEVTLSSTGLVGRPLNGSAEEAMGSWE
jgi:hypothetical protein